MLKNVAYIRSSIASRVELQCPKETLLLLPPTEIQISLKRGLRSYCSVIPVEFAGNLPSRNCQKPTLGLWGKPFLKGYLAGRTMQWNNARWLPEDATSHWLLLTSMHCWILELKKQPVLQELDVGKLHIPQELHVREAACATGALPWRSYCASRAGHWKSYLYCRSWHWRTPMSCRSMLNEHTSPEGITHVIFIALYCQSLGTCQLSKQKYIKGPSPFSQSRQ